MPLSSLWTVAKVLSSRRYTMTKLVVQTMLFVLFALITCMAFAVALVCIFQYDPERFVTLGQSLSFLSVSMLGVEPDYFEALKGGKEEEIVSTALYMLFLVVVPIMQINLLIAMCERAAVPPQITVRVCDSNIRYPCKSCLETWLGVC